MVLVGMSIASEQVFDFICSCVYFGGDGRMFQRYARVESPQSKRKTKEVALQRGLQD